MATIVPAATSLEQQPLLGATTSSSTSNPEKKLPAIFQKVFEALHKLSNYVPNSIPAKCSIASDVNSFFRNSLNAMGIASRVILSMGIVGGATNMVVGAYGMKRDAAFTYKALKHNDSEGAGVQATSFGISGSLFGLGAATIVSNSAALAPVTKASLGAAKLALAITPLLYVLYGGLAVMALYSIGTTGYFLAKMKAKENDYEALKGAIGSLSEAMKSGDQKRIEKEKMWLARRTSESCVRHIEEVLQNPNFLTDLEKSVDGKLSLDQVKILKVAENLVHDIKAASKRQIFKQTVLLVIAALGICATVFSAGIAPLVLFAVGAVLWLLIDYVRKDKTQLVELISLKLFPDTPKAQDSSSSPVGV